MAKHCRHVGASKGAPAPNALLRAPCSDPKRQPISDNKECSIRLHIFAIFREENVDGQPLFDPLMEEIGKSRPTLEDENLRALIATIQNSFSSDHQLPSVKVFNKLAAHQHTVENRLIITDGHCIVVLKSK